MKRIIIFLVSVFFFSESISQNVLWALSRDFTTTAQGLISDKSSNLYQYSNVQNLYYNFPAGASLTKFSASGVKIYEKSWSDSLTINQMIYDGADYFYFTGNFRGIINMGGVFLSSSGMDDGFLGKMDENGSVIWLRSFGGIKRDAGNGLTFNHDHSQVIVTGMVDSLVFIDGHYAEIAMREAFIGIYDLNGGLFEYQTFDFEPGVFRYNFGLEIKSYDNGYFLLADREGYPWYDQNPNLNNMPNEGRYLMTLDTNLNIINQAFIISPGCYYGYTCGRISSANGDAYVPRFCEHKYGGDGDIRRLAPLNSVVKWQKINTDGSYSDTYSHKNIVYYVGTEDANGCPCPGFDPGYGVIKMVDSLNNDQILIKKYKYHFEHITTAENGAIYVYGYYYNDTVELGDHKLKSGRFILALGGLETGIVKNNKEKSSQLLFPNPASDHFQIDSDYTIKEVKIFSMSGSLVYESMPMSKKCSVSGLPDGCYAVQVTGENKMSVNKVIISR